MPTYVLQVLFPDALNSSRVRPLGSVRRVQADTRAEADAILRADYRKRGITVHSIRSFGRV